MSTKYRVLVYTKYSGILGTTVFDGDACKIRYSNTEIRLTQSDIVSIELGITHIVQKLFSTSFTLKIIITTNLANNQKIELVGVEENRIHRFVTKSATQQLYWQFAEFSKRTTQDFDSFSQYYKSHEAKNAPRKLKSVLVVMASLAIAQMLVTHRVGFAQVAVALAALVLLLGSAISKPRKKF
jgi:hypothetical protein